MQIACGLASPLTPHRQAKPDILLNDDVLLKNGVLQNNSATALYFITNEDKFARITFDSFDAIKVCQGELLPYASDWDWKSDLPNDWLKIVQYSEWQQERYDYLVKRYDFLAAYHHRPDMNKLADAMLADYKHYILSFHDQFIEVIARGIWFEQSATPLQGQPLALDHPAQPLPPSWVEKIEHFGVTGFIYWNPKPIEQLKRDCQYHWQKLMEFRLDTAQGHISYTLVLEQQNSHWLVKLLSDFGVADIFDSIINADDIKPYLASYLQQVASRRAKS